MIDAARRAWVRRAVWLEVGSIFWMLAEGGVAVAAGAAAGSLSLMAFGLDSLIELCSASVVLWRLWVEEMAGAVSGAAEVVEDAEHRAARFVALSLGALALYILIGAGRALLVGAAPRSSVWGVVVAIAAAVAMPALWAVKARAATEIGSGALREDGASNLACGAMALVLLVGLVAQRWGVWWADPAAALVIGALVAREGVEAWGRVHARERPSVRAFLGLGSNVGDRAYWLATAVQCLDTGGVRVIRRSRVYETPPWGKTDQGPFLNQVVEVETGLPPRDLLARCRAVERALGRARGERWGPRTIDVDVLLYGDATIRLRDLVVPHPELHRRAFVLVPLLELRPQLTLPDGRALAALLDALPERTAITPVETAPRGGAAQRT